MTKKKKGKWKKQKPIERPIEDIEPEEPTTYESKYLKQC